MKQGNNLLEHVLFLLVVAGVFAYALYGALEFPTNAQTFPWFVAATALVITGVELILYVLSQRNAEEGNGVVDSIASKIGGILPYLVWLLAYYGAIYVIGMVSASALFVFLFLLIPGKMKWYYALLSAVLVLIFLISMEDVMS
ncbi:MAG: tripartite tricarboxylate transporter TctB family protein, partial [Cyanobacteria bacterium P01_D01_bin.2]